jgi:hypothetical protein
MEMIEKSEIYIPRKNDYENDDSVFDHSKVILRNKEERYFCAITDQRVCGSEKIDPSALQLIEIATDDIWPKYQPKFTRAPEPLLPNSYLKKPSFLDYGNPLWKHLGAQILQEAEICEILRLWPHPNIVKYLGS